MTENGVPEGPHGYCLAMDDTMRVNIGAAYGASVFGVLNGLLPPAICRSGAAVKTASLSDSKVVISCSAALDLNIV